MDSLKPDRAAAVTASVAMIGLTFFHPDAPTRAADVGAYITRTVPIHMVVLACDLLLLLAAPLLAYRLAAGGNRIAGIGLTVTAVALFLADGVHSVYEAFVLPAAFVEGGSKVLSLTEHVYRAPSWGILEMCGQLAVVAGLIALVFLRGSRLRIAGRALALASIALCALVFVWPATFAFFATAMYATLAVASIAAYQPA